MFDFPASPSTGQIFQPSGGPAWQFDGVAWKTLVTAQGFRGPTRTVFTALGASTYTIPAGCTSYDVEVVGGGGGAGSTSGASSAGTARAGAGGGAGGYAKKLIQVTDAIRAATKTITVGAGGAAAAGGGASSYADTVNTLTGNGGNPGGGMSPGSQLNYVSGGPGGSGTGGDINIGGATGSPGVSAGSTPNGASNASAAGGNGAPGPWGGGGQGVVVAAGTAAANNNGAAATAYGGGGGGGYAINVAGANSVGAAGGQGIIIITEYYTGDPTQPVTTAQARNRIVNPAMQVSQENGNIGGGVTAYYMADQWLNHFNGLPSVGAVRTQAFPTPTPNGSRNAIQVNYLTAKPSLAATDYGFFAHYIEGIKVADFGWGAAGAKQVVLQFQVYSSMAGTFSVAIRNGALNRCWIGTYTIAAADVGKFVQRTLVIPGDTTGTWPVDNSRAMEIDFTWAAGSSLTASATGWQAGSLIAAPGQANGASAVQSFLIADVQLHLDPANTGIAPPWAMPDEAQELAACMRYYQKGPRLSVSGIATAGGQAFYNSTLYPVPFRAAPTLAFGTPAYAGGSGVASSTSGANGCIAVVTGPVAAGGCFCSYDFIGSARM